MGSALNRDLPPYVMASGNYATTHGLNKEGLRRHGFSEDCIKALHKSYKILVRKHSKSEKIILELDTMAGQYPEVMRFREFIASSKRGITS